MCWSNRVELDIRVDCLFYILAVTVDSQQCFAASDYTKVSVFVRFALQSRRVQMLCHTRSPTLHTSRECIATPVHYTKTESINAMSDGYIIYSTAKQRS